MTQSGMTVIVRSTARLITGFIAVFGIYISLTGHISPGGGFAGGVILAAAAVLVVLAFGPASRTLVSEPLCRVWDATGALGFLAVAACGYFAGSFFVNFIPVGKLHHLASGGMIPLSNLAIVVKVGAGLAGAFLSLAAFRTGTAGKVE